MRLSFAYSRLIELNFPVLRTVDAAAALDISVTHASQLLGRLSAEKLIAPVRRGYWVLPSLKDPFMLAAYLCSPAPAYISLHSALHFHGVISQIPQRYYAVSLARSRVYKTSFGVFSIHHLNPDFFFGYDTHGPLAIKIASPEKALMDILFLRQNNLFLFKSLPELDPGAGLDQMKCRKILRAVKSRQRKAAMEAALREYFQN